MSVQDRQRTTAPASPPSSGLFGRGLLYVLVWSSQLLAGIIVSPILAHKLPPAEFGSLASGIALHQLICVLALLGIDKALVLQRAEDETDHASRGLIMVAIVIALIVTLALAVTASFWRSVLGFEGNSDLLYAVLMWTVPAAAIQVMLALLLTEDRFRPFAVLSALSAVGAQAVGLVLLFTVHNDAMTYAWGGVASQFVAMVVGIAFTRPSIRGLRNRPVIARALKLGFPMALGGLAVCLLSAGDRLVIQVLLGTEETGRYQIASVVGSVVVLLLSFTSGAWTPHFAALRTSAERTALAVRSRDELYRVVMPMVLGITLSAPTVLKIVAPASFRPESLTVVVFLVALSAFPVAASGATGQLLFTQRRGNVIAIVTAAAAVVNVILNFALLPILGIPGAALATVISYAMMATLQRMALPADIVLRGSRASLVAGVAVVILAAAASVVLPQSDEWNMIRFVLAVGCLPWFAEALRRARRATDETPKTRGSRVKHRAAPRTTRRVPKA
jgi:O-antigen/teichoic acid export membrane protein